MGLSQLETFVLSFFLSFSPSSYIYYMLHIRVLIHYFLLFFYLIKVHWVTIISEVT